MIRLNRFYAATILQAELGLIWKNTDANPRTAALGSC
jgi:hypothetical protein